MAQTKQEIRSAWNTAHYKRYTVNIRYDREQHMIDYIEKRKENGELTSEIIKDCIESLMEKEK